MMISVLGSTFDQYLDGQRLNRQQSVVFAAMLDGRWHTLSELHAATGAPEASVSARLRDFRRLGFTVARRRRGDPSSGLWEYLLVPDPFPDSIDR